MRVVVWVVLVWWGASVLFALLLIAVAIKEWAQRKLDQGGPSGDTDPLWLDFDRGVRRPR